MSIRQKPLFKTVPVFQGKGARSKQWVTRDTTGHWGARVEEKQEKGPGTGLVGRHRTKNLT